MYDANYGYLPYSFAVSAVMLKFFPSSDNNDAIATPANAQQAESGTSTVFSDGSTERFVAHRGYSNHAPENSIPAFELAGKIGFGVSKRIFAKQATVNSSVCTMTLLTEQQTVRELFPTTRLTI